MMMKFGRHDTEISEYVLYFYRASFLRTKH